MARDLSAAGAPAAAGRRAEYLRGFGLLLVLATAGLYVVKWNPYFHRALTAAATHSVGHPIAFGKTLEAPSPSLGAAVGYAQAYFTAVWQAWVLGLLLAATIESLLPRDWLARVLGRTSFGSSLLGGVLALPGMM
jgi:uncharacterized membrane protein YraQ (UPF0718 family)